GRKSGSARRSWRRSTPAWRTRPGRARCRRRSRTTRAPRRGARTVPPSPRPARPATSPRPARSRPMLLSAAGRQPSLAALALLERVAEDDQEDQVEGLEARQLSAPDRAHEHEQEEEDDRGAEDEVHRLGIDRHDAVEMRDRLVAVVQLDVLRAAADVRWVDL